MSGTITDAETKEPLAAVNIRIAGTSHGTITNAKGEYRLSIEPGNTTIIYSSLAYQPETLRTVIDKHLIHDVQLIPSPIQVPEVVVLAEDPALEIIRKAIAHKREWMNKLKSYQFEAFTRQVLRRDTSIASISESYTSGSMLIGDTLREVVRQKRQTQNIPLDENFTAVRGIVNFNEDEISLFRMNVNGNSSAYTFVGPTAPDALENYEYKLLNTTRVNGVEVYRIQMTPTSRVKPLFDGTITIADETFAVMGVDVRPNETFNIPFIKDVDLRYRQQFSLYNDEFWMPTDIRVTGSLNVSIIGFSLPRIGFEQTSSIYDYAINAVIPDSILQTPRLRVDSSASVIDSSFWKQHEVLPLTTEEESAYKTLDSTQTLVKQFEPKGSLASLGGDEVGSLFNMIDLRFNRVEGFYAGVKREFENIIPYSTLHASIGYGFSDSIVKYEIGGTFYTSKAKTFGAGGSLYRKLDNVPDGNYFGPLPISFMALLDKNDYRDYFLSTGWNLFVTTKPLRRLSASLTFLNERQATMDNKSNYSLISRDKLFRQNPPIADGTLRAFRLDFRFGPPPVALDLVSRNAFEFSVEHSSPSIANSDFGYTRYSGMLEWNVRTFATRLLFAPTLRIKLSAGTSSGLLPPQRLFSIDSRASGYAPFGVLHGASVKEFGGDRFVMLNLEHNFRNVPFLAMNIPFLYRNGIELIVHGSVAQAWLGSTSTSGGWYGEAGIGISRIFDIIRTDFTYRFNDPQRLYFTVSVANLF